MYEAVHGAADGDGRTWEEHEQGSQHMLLWRRGEARTGARRGAMAGGDSSAPTEGEHGSQQEDGGEVEGAGSSRRSPKESSRKSRRRWAEEGEQREAQMVGKRARRTGRKDSPREEDGGSRKAREEGDEKAHGQEGDAAEDKDGSAQEADAGQEQDEDNQDGAAMRAHCSEGAGADGCRGDAWREGQRRSRGGGEQRVTKRKHHQNGGGAEKSEQQVTQVSGKQARRYETRRNKRGSETATTREYDAKRPKGDG
jgi:hypothetical protein